jgi:hypothetical protein
VEIVFLRNVVTAQGIKIDEDKVKAIQNWLTTKSITELKSFHDLTSFYRCFVKDFSTIATPLIKIVKNYISFKWGDQQDMVFNL